MTKNKLFIVSIILVSILFSFVAFADNEKDWKLLTSFGVEWDKAVGTNALVLTVEYDKVLNDGEIILFGGADIDYYLSMPDYNEGDSKTFINPYVGVDYKLSNVTTLESRIDYSVKDKAPTILVRVIFEW